MNIITLEDGRRSLMGESTGRYATPARPPQCRPARMPRLQINIPVTTNVNAGNTNSYSPQDSPITVTDASQRTSTRRTGAYSHYGQRRSPASVTPAPAPAPISPTPSPVVPSPPLPSPMVSQGSSVVPDALAPLRPVERRIQSPAFV